MASFNHQQRMAVEHVDHPCLVLAGPGSGKTTVITHRTKKLIEEESKPEENEKPQIEIEIEKKEDTADTEEVNTEEVDKEEE